MNTIAEAVHEMRTLADNPDGWFNWEEIAEDLHAWASLIERLDRAPPVLEVRVSIDDMEPRLRELIAEKLRGRGNEPA